MLSGVLAAELFTENARFEQATRNLPEAVQGHTVNSGAYKSVWHKERGTEMIRAFFANDKLRSFMYANMSNDELRSLEKSHSIRRDSDWATHPTIFSDRLAMVRMRARRQTLNMVSPS